MAKGGPPLRHKELEVQGHLHEVTRPGYSKAGPRPQAQPQTVPHHGLGTTLSSLYSHGQEKAGSRDQQQHEGGGGGCRPTRRVAQEGTGEGWLHSAAAQFSVTKEVSRIENKFAFWEVKVGAE